MAQYADEDVNLNKTILFTANKNDQNKLNTDALNMKANNSIDKRIQLEHTFTTTSTEIIRHNLGRIPIGYIVANKTANATIYGDSTTWTKQEVRLTSSAQPNTVLFIFF